MNPNPTANFAHVRMLLQAEKLLTAEYETARDALSQDPEGFEACIAAMRRLRVFLRTREIPHDIAEKLNASGHFIAPHICHDDLERYHLNMIPESTELAVIEEHLLWCRHCLDRLEATERFIDMVRRGIVRGGFDLELDAPQ